MSKLGNVLLGESKKKEGRDDMFCMASYSNPAIINIMSCHLPHVLYIMKKKKPSSIFQKLLKGLHGLKRLERVTRNIKISLRFVRSN